VKRQADPISNPLAGEDGWHRVAYAVTFESFQAHVGENWRGTVGNGGYRWDDEPMGRPTFVDVTLLVALLACEKPISPRAAQNHAQVARPRQRVLACLIPKPIER
jgi:hypothetical protein